MNELQAKLARRRTQVEEGGLHFESTPVAAAAAAETSKDAPAKRDFGGCASVKLPQGGGADFLSAISRRRATVDDGAETFESKTTSSTADVVAKGEGPTWAKPTVNKLQTNQKAAGNVGSPAGDEGSPAQVGSPGLAAHGATSGAAEDAAQVPAFPGNDPGLPAAAADDASGEAEEEDPPPEEDPRLLRSAPAAEEEGDSQAAPAAPTTAPAASAEPVLKSFLEPLHDKTRVNWHLEYNARLPSVIESPPFSIDGYEPVHMKLHPRGIGDDGGDCVMSLHGPSPRRPAGLKAMLFLGKGWAKRSTRDWPDGQDLIVTFPGVDFEKRTTILCGIVYQAP
mmetsp:Transcript_6636/g.17819  ORF Transcript_6636/g.17819 Transcript_6636/m.17819 type:complete len:338 (+) Transcript_6636:153-1166(+)